MNTKFKVISLLLIVILSILLIVIVMAYYNKPVDIATSTNHEIQNLISGNQKNEEKIIVNETQETHEEIIIQASGDSGDANLEKEIKSENNNTSNPIKPVIISSEDSMTSKEKRQILTELDDALMDLLDVVDKVQTVDETRLITDEGEVQQ